MAAEIAGLAGTPSPQVITVQGVTGGVPIPVDVVIGDEVTANQGDPNTIPNAWPIKVTDGVETANVTPAGKLEVKEPNLDVALSTRASEATLLNVLTTAAFQARINTLGQKTMANSTPVVLPSDQIVNVSTTPSASTGSAVTQVAGSLVVVTLQAANAARKGLTLYNDGTQPWYVKLGAGATLTSFTVKILRDGYYEVPFGYTGIVTGIQAVASSFLYVDELT